MRKLVLTAMAGLAGLSAAAFTPSKADASPAVALELGLSAETLTPVQWGGYGGGYYGRPYRPYGVYRPYRPYRPYGVYRPYRPAYVAPSCWVERRWVQTPWGPEPRRVRICR
ncbi:MAG: hypothetical protein LCH88_19185 [Proteobacteria bacterium]|nr:hypothetical protein [Pseudomonadota bacterium]